VEDALELEEMRWPAGFGVAYAGDAIGSGRRRGFGCFLVV
jgi:hypothetical protein